MQRSLTRPLFVALLAWLCVFAHREAAAAEPNLKRPNIIVFLTDDQGWGDAGIQGHPRIKTPNLDRFAKQGLRLTQCYAACSVCSPSRSAILTGRTPYRNGVWRWIPGGSQYHLRSSEITIAKLLKGIGYETCHVGKWHLNGKFNSDEQPQPDDHGYDHWFATQNNASPNHKNPRNFVRNRKEVGQLEGFSAPLTAKEAVDWLDGKVAGPKGKRDASKPFFIAVWTHEPHLPIESDPKFMALYKDIADADRRQHHGNITQLDHAFGMVLKKLDDMGVADNTFVMFTSDNGPEGRTGDRGRTRGSTGGLNGRKRSSYEGGIRVPGAVRWPAYFRKVGLKAGSESATPVIGSDIFTTLCEITGIAVPSDRTIDGASMLPIFEGKPIDRKQPLYWRNHLASAQRRVAMRIGDWKILCNAEYTHFELYNLKDDWQEKHELSKKEPAKFAEMKAKIIAYDKSVLEEGPDWWKNDKKRTGKPKGTKKQGKKGKAPKLNKGEDKTGEFSEVKGGVIRKGEDGGYVLEGSGEAIAVKKLDKPVTQGTLTLKASFRSMVKVTTRNALLAFGSEPTNDKLIKAGTAIGMGSHVVFQGGWGDVSSGAKAGQGVDKDATFDLTVSIDLKKREVTATVGKSKMTYALPADVKDIRYVGYYVKNTSSAFSEIEMSRE